MHLSRTVYITRVQHSTFNQLISIHISEEEGGLWKFEDIIVYTIRIIESFQNLRMASNKWANITEDMRFLSMDNWNEKPKDSIKCMIIYQHLAVSVERSTCSIINNAFGICLFKCYSSFNNTIFYPFYSLTIYVCTIYIVQCPWIRWLWMFFFSNFIFCLK